MDTEEHTVVAETVVSMIQAQTLSYSEFFSIFCPMICAFIFPTTTNRFHISKTFSKNWWKFICFIQVDFGTIWCEALCNIIGTVPNSTNFTPVRRRSETFRENKCLDCLVVGFNLQSNIAWFIRSRSNGYCLIKISTSIASTNVRESFQAMNTRYLLIFLVWKIAC